jgi:hypothetical protein
LNPVIVIARFQINYIGGVVEKALNFFRCGIVACPSKSGSRKKRQYLPANQTPAVAALPHHRVP